VPRRHLDGRADTEFRQQPHDVKPAHRMGDGVCEIVAAPPEALQPTPDVRSDAVSSLVSAVFILFVVGVITIVQGVYRLA